VLGQLGVGITVVECQEKPDGDFKTCEYPNPETDAALRESYHVAQGRECDVILGTDPDCVMRPVEDDVEREILGNVLRQLPAREQTIISMRFGLAGQQEMTQKEVADKLGISQSYISRLEKRIIQRMKKEMLRAL
jgi:RNA polymerase sigma factor (sigma-70 family)